MIGFTNAKARASLQVNKAGTIYNTGEATGYAINKGGTIYTFPQNDKCMLNLSANTWQSNSLSDSSFMLYKDVSLSISGNTKSTFGNYSTNDSGTEELVNNVSGHWYLPQRSATKIGLATSFSSAEFTAQIEFKVNGNMTNYTEIMLFKDLDNIRIEKTNTSTNIGVYRDSESAKLLSMDVTSLRSWNTITFVNSASRFELWLGDTLMASKSDGGYTNLTTISNLYLFTNKALSGSMGTTSCTRRLRLWSCALTQDEITASLVFP